MFQLLMITLILSVLILAIITNQSRAVLLKHVFEKYKFRSVNADAAIPYLSVRGAHLLDPHKKHYCHLHCNGHDTQTLFDAMIEEYRKTFNVIITCYDHQSVRDDVCIVQIKDKGGDIGAKIAMIQYLLQNNLPFHYIFFMGSEWRPDVLASFQGRSELVKCILQDRSKTTGAIFPDSYNFTYDADVYVRELLSILSVSPGKNSEWFHGTPTFILSKRVVYFIFRGRTSLFYNMLKEEYRARDNRQCVEKAFQRIWNPTLQHLGENYVCLPAQRICDFYAIKINAIYFPQFHDSKENNEFWEPGFTEWTLLRPFYDEISLRGNKIAIMKPHDSIGYYSLDDYSVFQRQKKMAKDYGIHGFVFYHYWFGNDRRVLYKIEDYVLRDGEDGIPFCFSWANEPWTRNWDGSNKEPLIEQNYEDDDNYRHIIYLVQFFKMKNYMRTSKGECLFYIYNYQHIKSKWEKIKKKWKVVLDASGLTLKIVTTKNADPANHHEGTERKYEFLPLCQSNAWTSYKDSKLSSRGHEVGAIPLHYEIDYADLVQKYSQSKEVKDNYHLGLPLSWNNIVRKKNMPHLHTLNFTKKHLEDMMRLLIAKTILRHQNRYTSSNGSNIPHDDNIIIVNAWNEWNEQAILEPNNVTNFENLETIRHIIRNW